MVLNGFTSVIENMQCEVLSLSLNKPTLFFKSVISDIDDYNLGSFDKKSDLW